ncbi:YycH family regulatory protein [Alkalicoccus urumqiensis]|uniref:Regulatory protein YycH domain-containing protein n=1 Tax=Alkalicoccus urumqiensis TaxID=1548213 RepID=A0A2P6MDL7_ALKUR|nr:two-component system activity regulator YycH [Alkalicoccus urumqiensis]PRO64367.1 hypothetical protein C6I21_15270 [Alkalicoccus urumqiensis]
MPVIEHVKTAVLWTMVLTSLVLTWFVWTYQPAYSELDDPEEAFTEVESIGETKAFSELFYPSAVISHEEEASFLLQQSAENYVQLMEDLREVEIEAVEQTNGLTSEDLQSFNGLEIQFDSPLQERWLEQILTVPEEEGERGVLPSMEQADRILLTVTEEDDVVIRFIDLEGDNVYEAGTTLEAAELTGYTRNAGMQRIPVEARVFQPEEERVFQEIHYVPAERVEEELLTYNIIELEADTFVQSLFADPSIVQEYPEEGERYFTDGSRYMQLENDDTTLEYVQPDIVTGSLGASESVLRTSQEFVNGHSGWTDRYFMTSWSESGFNDQASYSLHMDGYPVLSADTNNPDHYMIQLTREGANITNYTRPMFRMSEEPLEIGTRIELPSFAEVESYIESEELFGLDVVENARIGYYMRVQNSIAVFEPSWYVEVRGQWQRITIPDAGTEVENGLE